MDKFIYNTTNTTPLKVYYGGEAPFDMDDGAIGKTVALEAAYFDETDRKVKSKPMGERKISEVFQSGKKGEFVQVVFVTEHGEDE